MIHITSPGQATILQLDVIFKITSFVYHSSPDTTLSFGEGFLKMKVLLFLYSFW